MAQKKQASGGARLIAKGKRPMMLGWPQDQAAIIEAAAVADGRPMTQFVMHYALERAKEILRKKGKSS